MYATQLTLSTFNASSQTCMPRDSNTSTQPRYLTGNWQSPERTACSSDCHWCGFDDSGTRSFLRRNESRNERRKRSIFFGDRLLNRNDADFCKQNDTIQTHTLLLINSDHLFIYWHQICNAILIPMKIHY